MTTQDRAAKLVVGAAIEGVRVRGSIHYSQGVRRWEGITKRILGPKEPSVADCSSYTTWLFWQARERARGKAGVDVVNGLGWKAGYTGTQVVNGRRHRSTRRFWRPGRTLIFYGQPRVEHVAVFVGRSAAGVEMVVSHGSEAGPLFLPWNYRADFNQARAYRL